MNTNHKFVVALPGAVLLVAMGTKQRKQTGSVPLPAGASSSELIEKFSLSEAWADKLRHAFRYPYLEEAREGLGCSDSSINACSCLWNPLKFAELLMLREGTPREEMTVIIEKHFPDWHDAWRAATFDRVSHEWDSEY